MRSIAMTGAPLTARNLVMCLTVLAATALLAACGGGGGTAAATDPTPAPMPTPTPTNKAPVVSAGSDQTIALPTDNANLSGSATDDGLPTGSKLSYSWSMTSGPPGPNNGPGVIFADASAAATGARFVGGPGTYTLTLSVSDTALTGVGTVHITVNNNPNDYPTAATATGSGWLTVTPASENMDSTKLDQAKTYSMTAGVTGNEAGYIIRHGHLVYSWGDSTTLYAVKSTTKSMGGLALLLALDQGKLALSDQVSTKLSVFGTDPPIDTSPVPNASLSSITVLQLSTHTSGLSKSDQGPAPNAANTRQLLYAPGTTWSYSDQGLNWLADVLTETYAQDLKTLMFSSIYTPLGIGANELAWRDNIYRSTTLSVGGTPVPRRELGSGISANVNAMARVGLLMLRQGVWANQPLLSNAVVAQVHTPPTQVASATIADPTNFPGATTNYGILWWTNATGQMSGVPTDAYWAWGLHEVFIIVVPSLDLVIARAGDHAWNADGEFWNANYSVLAPFLTPIVQSVSH